jgi:acetylornithine/N-succinyldiaminopimelate aminotransferase
VQTGNGRTGKLWGYELSGIEPDVATLAKGLANGLPIGACLAKDSACVFEPGDHASTFGGNPLACAAALAVWEEFIYGEVLQNCQRTGAYFKQQLELLAEQTGLVEEVRGWGLMLGCEFKREIAGEVNAKLLERGILANAIANKTLRFVPPLILQQKNVDQAVEALREILAEYV